MNELSIFNFDQKEIRTITKDGEPWFVAKDICDILELEQVSKAVSRLDEDEVTKITIIDSLGRNQETNIINESGLYSLVLTSNKQEAKQFKKWITHEVLPSIRKTGKYDIKKSKIIQLEKRNTELEDENFNLKLKIKERYLLPASKKTSEKLLYEWIDGMHRQWKLHVDKNPESHHKTKCKIEDLYYYYYKTYYGDAIELSKPEFINILDKEFRIENGIIYGIFIIYR